MRTQDKKLGGADVQIDGKKVLGKKGLIRRTDILHLI